VLAYAYKKWSISLFYHILAQRKIFLQRGCSCVDTFLKKALMHQKAQMGKFFHEKGFIVNLSRCSLQK